MGAISLDLQIKETEARGDEVIALGPPGSLWRLGEKNRVLRDERKGWPQAGKPQGLHKMEETKFQVNV